LVEEPSMKAMKLRVAAAEWNGPRLGDKILVRECPRSRLKDSRYAEVRPALPNLEAKDASGRAQRCLEVLAKSVVLKRFGKPSYFKLVMGEIGRHLLYYTE
jgi:hypothetical protein